MHIRSTKPVKVLAFVVFLMIFGAASPYYAYGEETDTPALELTTGLESAEGSTTLPSVIESPVEEAASPTVSTTPPAADFPAPSGFLDWLFFVRTSSEASSTAATSTPSVWLEFIWTHFPLFGSMGQVVQVVNEVAFSAPSILEQVLEFFQEHGIAGDAPEPEQATLPPAVEEVIPTPETVTEPQAPRSTLIREEHLIGKVLSADKRRITLYVDSRSKLPGATETDTVGTIQTINLSSQDSVIDTNPHESPSVHTGDLVNVDFITDEAGTMTALNVRVMRRGNASSKE